MRVDQAAAVITISSLTSEVSPADAAVRVKVPAALNDTAGHVATPLTAALAPPPVSEPALVVLVKVTEAALPLTSAPNTSLMWATIGPMDAAAAPPTGTCTNSI